jgi:tripartite-type tricarboxylate transporter receptor subunit TctC
MKAGVRKTARVQHRSAPRSNERHLVTQHPRRRVLRLAAGAAALPAISRTSWAQAYPTRPVRIVVGFPAGGSNDLYGRLIAQWLSERLGQQFVVENRAGAGGNLAAESVAHAAPDGYALLVATSGEAWNATLYDNLKYNFIRDFSAVAPISRGPGALVVHPSVSARSVPELIAYVKANPGKVTVASAGIGSVPHMFWALFKSLTGADMLHVAYRGGAPLATDLIGGHVQVCFSVLAAMIEHVRAGKLRPLAVTTATRLAVLPDVPTIGEFMPGYEASIYVGIVAPRNTPVGIVNTLNQEINLALADARIKQRIADLGDATLALSAADFGKLIADETEKWGKVIRAANIKAE